MQQKTEEILRDNGWYADRKINIEDSIHLLEKRGYKITESFKKFFEEFGKLKISVNVKGNQRTINFEIYTPVRYDYDDVIQTDYPKIIVCNNLIPVGNIDMSSYIAIDDSAELFTFTDGDVMKLGKGEIAVENLLNKEWRAFEVYPIPDWWGE